MSKDSILESIKRLNTMIDYMIKKKTKKGKGMVGGSSVDPKLMEDIVLKMMRNNQVFATMLGIDISKLRTNLFSADRIVPKAIRSQFLPPFDYILFDSSVTEAVKSKLFNAIKASRSPSDFITRMNALTADKSFKWNGIKLIDLKTRVEGTRDTDLSSKARLDILSGLAERFEREVRGAPKIAPLIVLFRAGGTRGDLDENRFWNNMADYIQSVVYNPVGQRPTTLTVDEILRGLLRIRRGEYPIPEIPDTDELAEELRARIEEAKRSEPEDVPSELADLVYDEDERLITDSPAVYYYKGLVNAIRKRAEATRAERAKAEREAREAEERRARAEEARRAEAARVQEARLRQQEAEAKQAEIMKPSKVYTETKEQKVAREAKELRERQIAQRKRDQETIQNLITKLNEAATKYNQLGINISIVLVITKNKKYLSRYEDNASIRKKIKRPLIDLKSVVIKFVDTYNFVKGLKSDTEEEFVSDDPSTYLKSSLFKKKNIPELERLLDKLSSFNSFAEEVILWFKQNMKSIINLTWEEYVDDIKASEKESESKDEMGEILSQLGTKLPKGLVDSMSSLSTDDLAKLPDALEKIVAIDKLEKSGSISREEGDIMTEWVSSGDTRPVMNLYERILEMRDDEEQRLSSASASASAL